MRPFHRRCMRLRSSSDFSLPLKLDAWDFVRSLCGLVRWFRRCWRMQGILEVRRRRPLRCADRCLWLASLIVRVRLRSVSPPRSMHFTALSHVLDVSAHPYASNAYLLPQTYPSRLKHVPCTLSASTEPKTRPSCLGRLLRTSFMPSPPQRCPDMSLSTTTCP
ncbi:hypothetical protein OG21DRAFT_263027 [Imleria badia]|nr:hypothetical protein OG21DRAFT_263027 [Imleria badia]